MVTLTKNGFESSYDLDEMLYEDMEWLYNQIKLPRREFEKIAKEMELDQENWNRFWNKIRRYRTEERNIECDINGKTKFLTKEEFEVVKQILGSPDEMSNCCSADIIGTDICSDCKEHCGKVYIF